MVQEINAAMVVFQYHKNNSEYSLRNKPNGIFNMLVSPDLIILWGY